MTKLHLCAATALGTLFLNANPAFAQSTAFTYQGRLNNGGNAANGLFDFQFKLFADPLGATQAGSNYLTNGVPATNGLFTVTIDFGASAFNGSNRWLEVDVKTNLAATFTPLSPRQAVTPTPYALTAGSASNLLGTVSSANLAGTYGNAVALNNASNSFSGGFSGDGGGLTNLNVTQFAAGSGINIQTNNSGAPNVIEGASVNFAAAGVEGATISGGGADDFGGASYTNSVTGEFGTVGGGEQNTADNNATVGGGAGNTASGIGSTVGGGTANTASGSDATVGGGFGNQATSSATVPGGVDNIAGGQYSFAAGLMAQATNDGTFVWADSQPVPFVSTANNQFLIRATGGVGINTNSGGGFALNVNGSARVSGNISSPQWKATTLINSVGALPLFDNFLTSGGTLVISVSGSGFSKTAGALIGMSITLDGAQIDTCSIFANPALTHLAFVPKTIVKTGVAAGFHTITLTAFSTTTTDSTDNYCVTVQEVPF